MSIQPTSRAIAEIELSVALNAIVKRYVTTLRTEEKRIVMKVKARLAREAAKIAETNARLKAEGKPLRASKVNRPEDSRPARFIVANFRRIEERAINAGATLDEFKAFLKWVLNQEDVAPADIVRGSAMYVAIQAAEECLPLVRKLMASRQLVIAYPHEVVKRSRSVQQLAMAR